MFGYSKDEIEGKSLAPILPARFLTRHESAMDRATELGQLVYPGTTHELFGTRKDGTEFPLELTISQWTISGVIYYSGILRDVTARKEAEAQLRFLSEALRSAADGVAIIDPEDIVRWVNPSFTEITGYPENEIIGNERA